MHRIPFGDDLLNSDGVLWPCAQEAQNGNRVIKFHGQFAFKLTPIMQISIGRLPLDLDIGK